MNDEVLLLLLMPFIVLKQFFYTFIIYKIKLHRKTKRNKNNRNPVGSKLFLMKSLVEWKTASRATHAVTHFAIRCQSYFS